MEVFARYTLEPCSFTRSPGVMVAVGQACVEKYQFFVLRHFFKVGGKFH